jgi:hypothetical protein
MNTEKLMWLGFVPDVDFIAQDDGEGPYIKEWLSATAQPSDAEIEAAVEPTPVVTEVTAAQALLALDHATLLDTVETVVSAHPVKAVKIWYQRANVWEKSNPYVWALASELGLTDEQVNALFLFASKM